ncbi:hypothetical protein Tco_0590833 [Tanacetum coccineum]
MTMIEDRSSYIKLLESAQDTDVGFGGRDRNSGYFHMIIKGRTHSSKIHVVYDDMGTYYEGSDIVGRFVEHLEGFLGKSSSTNITTLSDDLFTIMLYEEDTIAMIREVTNKEIKNAMFYIGDCKAPG